MYHAHNLYLNMLAEIGIARTYLLYNCINRSCVVTSIRLKGDVFRKAASIGVGAFSSWCSCERFV